MASPKDNGIKPLPYSRPPRDQLRRASASTPPTPPLHLVHITEIGYADEIIRSGQMVTRNCEVFGYPLLYTYVGRPAFRVRDGAQRHESIARYPFAFLIAPDNLPNPHHVHPFDTGAGHKGIFGDAANPKHVFRQDFELENSLEAAHRHIAWAFESNENYYRGALRPDLESTFGHVDWVLHAFAAIARLGNRSSNTAPDMRTSSVEVAFNRPLDVNGNVKLVILPQQVVFDTSADALELRNRMAAMGVAHATYDWDPTRTPDDHMDEITRLVEAFLFRGATP